MLILIDENQNQHILYLKIYESTVTQIYESTVTQIYERTVTQIYESTVTQMCPSSPLTVPCVLHTDHDPWHTWPASQPVSIQIFLQLSCHVLGLTSGVSSTELQVVLWVPWKATCTGIGSAV